MNVDASIKDSILACGIPQSALSTTLLLQGEAKLRTYVLQREWEKKGDGRALFLHPTTPKARTHALKVFHVLAKEFVLMGADIHFITLTRLMRNVLSDTEDYDDDLAYRIDNAEAVFVSGFQDNAFPKNPHTDDQIFEFYEWLNDFWVRGRLVYFFADATVQRCTAWWDTTFLAQIEERVDHYEVAEAK